MKLLIDTHAFLWFVTGDERLSPRARRAMEKQDVDMYLSAASVWEMAIKSSLGRLTLPNRLHQYVAQKSEEGFRPLPVEWRHAAAVEALPARHRDPFDLLLIAQALEEDLVVVSADAAFRSYGVRVLW